MGRVRKGWVVCTQWRGSIRVWKRMELRMRVRETLERVRYTLVVCEVLPRRGVSDERLPRAILINSLLADFCKSNGWPFVDNWNTFYGRNTMLSGDVFN